MVEIRRTDYLERLEQLAAAPVVVALLGLRRVGKSVVLRQLSHRLEEQDAEVLYINKEDLSYDEVRTARDLVDYVGARRSAAETYVLIDEVQYIEDWERGVASLNGQGDVRVVISGSSSSMLAGDLATRLSGRFVTLRMLPLSLSEFGELYAATQGEEIPPRQLLQRYRSVGGLPGLLHTDLSSDVTVQMQRDIFSTIALRDIISRHRIRDVNTFEAITSFAMDNVGDLVSAKRISDFLKSTRRTGSPDTVLNYLEFLTEAFVFDRVERFDVPGKRRLEINAKYYLGDLGLRSVFSPARDRWIAGDLENLVYHELLRRGYRVSVGVVRDSEIDFVAEQGDGRAYIQVAYLLESESTVNRALAPLLAQNDAYPRYLISMDTHSPGGLKGVKHLSLLDFLMGESLQ